MITRILKHSGPALVLVASALSPATAADEVDRRLARIEATLDLHFRGPGLAERHTELQGTTEAFNAFVTACNAKSESSTEALQPELAAANRLLAAIEASKSQLPPRPAESDGPGVAAYNSAVVAHNAIVQEYTGLQQHLQSRLDAQKRQRQAFMAELESRRAAIASAEADFQRRNEAARLFEESGGPVKIADEINRLLADLRCAERAGQSRPEALRRVRAFRRELALQAIARHRARAHGLMLVEARVGDEPCWFVLDTGAQRVTLSLDLVRALGWETRCGSEEALRGVGNVKAQGRPLVLPDVAVQGHAVADVAAFALAQAEDAGIDGLLGQSFLAHFRLVHEPGAVLPVILEPPSEYRQIARQSTASHLGKEALGSRVLAR